MPINKKWDIDALLNAAEAFEKTLKRGERFTFEYVLLGGVNDSDDDAERLAALLRQHDLKKAKINLIPHNPAEQLNYFPPKGIRYFVSRRYLSETACPHTFELLADVTYMLLAASLRRSRNRIS